jgi:hypothetical protein
MDSCDSFEKRGGALHIRSPSSVEVEILLRIRGLPHTLEKLYPFFMSVINQLV